MEASNSHIEEVVHGVEHHDDHAHHHHDDHYEPFITKYIFSQDHKMIAKQFLITGIIWAAIAGICLLYTSPSPRD